MKTSTICGFILLFTFLIVVAHVTFAPSKGELGKEQDFNALILGEICAAIGVFLLHIGNRKRKTKPGGFEIIK
jgi:hypothetical protein